MVDRRPQDFAGGEPDGMSDNTAAIQAAIDAWQPGDQVVLSGGTFSASGALVITTPELLLVGDAVLGALAGFAGEILLRIEADGVTLDADGLELDQADQIVKGRSIRIANAAAVAILGVRSRGTQHAFIELGSAATDLLVDQVDHLGKGYGVLTESSAAGIADVLIRGSTFEHAGSGALGDGVEINVPDFGARDVDVIACVARGYIGGEQSAGIGFGAAGCTRFRAIGCLAESCEGDGFHWEESPDGAAFDCRAIDCGPADVGAPGSAGQGFAVYQSDRWRGNGLLALRCQRHGIALIATSNSARPAQSAIFRCAALDAGRDGVHLTGQESATIDRTHARDPSRAEAGAYAGIHLGRQGVLVENRNCAGADNSVELTGATTVLGETVVREASIDCTIDGVSGSGTDPGPTSDPLVAILLPPPWIADQPFRDATFFVDGTGFLEPAA